ncbi:MAG: hypothetical protein K9L31_02735, partial [Candidatus Pacebacteria bacterium]|nr:hypothetical protein [Candidatus Paceibacterota bacterium]
MSYKPLYVNTDTEKKTNNTKTDVKAKYTPLYAGVEETPRIETESRIENETKPRANLSTTINKIAEIVDKPMSVISKPFDILLKAGTDNKKEESKFSIGGQTAPQIDTNKLSTGTSTKTSTKEPEYSSNAKIIPQKEKPTGLDQFGLPASTISQAKQKEEDINFWGKVARTILPKGAEEYFGLNKGDSTIKDRIQKAEDAKQAYFRQQRKEENIALVKTEDEEYTPPTTFAEKWAELGEYGNYAKNVWNGFLKPAIGITAEQAGITTDSPKLRKWGEQFTDRVFEEESRRASAKSMANVPGALEGGLIDPRYYAKTMTQAIGFMSPIFGTCVVTT